MVGDPGFVERWTERESRALNAGLVTAKRSLAELLREAAPACRTRSGETWPIDPAALRRLATGCTKTEAEALRLPISLHFSGELGDACYVTDPAAAAALRRAEAFGPAFPYREGRMYLPLSLAIDLVSRYGGAIQQVFL